MTIQILSAALVILLIALVYVTTAWRRAEYYLRQQEDLIVALDDTREGFMLDVDMAAELSAEADNIREWRDEQKDNGQ